MSNDFIRDMVEADVKAGAHGGKVQTRFPPEPNGHLHIGHAKSICLNFGVAADFGGACNLRMDDTNPTTEDPEYVAAIQRDVKWLGFDWADRLYYASDYYERLYELAEKLIVLGRAYVCDLDEEQMAEYRGTITAPGKDSPFRARTVDENLARFRAMRRGELPEGACVLRARIDMASPNMKMRDPPLYRIKHAHHYRTGDAWCIYPLYDYAHCLSDSFEGVTHSLCTMEFESARELYDWVIAATEVPWVPRQTEFARLNLTYTVMSKRRLLELVQGKHVSGWDDPRMPTIAGLRRRGYTPESIRDFCARIGVAKNLSLVDVALLEHAAREDLDGRSPRVLAVLKPLRLVVENWDEGRVDELEAPYFAADANAKGAGPRDGTRKVPFGRVLYIERDDFLEDPPKDFFRLAPGRAVRLRHAYIVTCTGVTKDATGELTEVRCTVDEATRGGAARPGTKVDGTIHWVSEAHALDAEVRLYDRLFTREVPGDESGDFKADLNPASLTVTRAKLEPSLASARAGDRFQFERVGYFFVDPVDAQPGAPVFNRTLALKDGWAKAQARATAAPPAGGKVDKRSKTEPKKASAAPATLELDDAARALRDAHGITGEEARTLSSEPAARALFEASVAAGAKAPAAASLVCNDVLGELRARGAGALKFGGAELAELLALVADGTLSSKLAKDVLAELFAAGGAPRAIVLARGMQQVRDTGAIEAAVERVLAANADAVARYRAGNANVLGALVGLAIKETGGKADPKLVREALAKRLSA